MCVLTFYPTLFLTLNKGGPLIVCERVKELQF